MNCAPDRIPMTRELVDKNYLYEVKYKRILTRVIDSTVMFRVIKQKIL